MTKLEICCYSLQSCLQAQAAGAHRIELCSSPAEGGLTPTEACIRRARKLFHGELFVMIRPRGGDFYYSDLEFVQMKEEIERIKALDVDGFVFGILHADGSVDAKRTRQLIELANPKPVCFHRAFDMCNDFQKALTTLIDIGCHRILSSGGHQRAIEGIDNLKALVAQSGKRIEIMAGSGVNAENASALLAIGIDALHASCSSKTPSPMIYKNPKLTMGADPNYDEYQILEADPKKISKILNLISSITS